MDFRISVENVQIQVAQMFFPSRYIQLNVHKESDIVSRFQIFYSVPMLWLSLIQLCHFSYEGRFDFIFYKEYRLQIFNINLIFKAIAKLYDI